MAGGGTRIDRPPASTTSWADARDALGNRTSTNRPEVLGGRACRFTLSPGKRCKCRFHHVNVPALSPPTPAVLGLAQAAGLPCIDNLPTMLRSFNHHDPAIIMKPSILPLRPRHKLRPRHRM